MTKASSVDYGAGVLGLLLIAHAGYLTSAGKDSHQLSDGSSSQLPTQVLVEILIALIFCFWAALRVPGTLQPIKLSAYNNRLVELPSQVEFMTFSHRGAVKPIKLDSKLK